MASIRKRGNSYQITVSKGRDQKGRQLLETTTFVPDTQRTEKQNQKALERFVYEFEQKVLSGKYLDGEKASLDCFAKVWFTEYAEQHLAPTTIDTYQFLYRIHISPAIGNMKLAKIQPLQLNKLYNSMLKTRKDGKDGGTPLLPSNVFTHCFQACSAPPYNGASSWRTPVTASARQNRLVTPQI